MYLGRRHRWQVWSLVVSVLAVAWPATRATTVALAGTSRTASHATAARESASPPQDDEVRRGGKGGATAKPKGDVPPTPQQDGARAVPREQPRAVPREEPRAREKSSPPPPRARPDRAEPPHRYSAVPRPYSFPPVDLRAGFYYHPYFGFYYGPYYGPFYPHPGPYDRRVRYSVSAVRLRVRPDETQVYVNGYYAGIVDDFDGAFQRLYVPAGEHRLDFRLEGYESFGQSVYVSAGATLDIRHQMLRLAPGRTSGPPPTPRSLPEEWTAADLAGEGDPPATPFGILAIRSDPADAQLLIDGEAWVPATGRSELVIHLAVGWHRIEVRKEAFRTFATSVELSEGQTTRLSVTLEHQMDGRLSPDRADPPWRSR